MAKKKRKRAKAKINQLKSHSHSTVSPTSGEKSAATGLRQDEGQQTIRPAAESICGENDVKLLLQKGSVGITVIKNTSTRIQCKQQSSTCLASIDQPETSVNILSGALNTLSLERPFSDSKHHTFVQQHGICMENKKINLIANYFPIDIPEGKIYHYDVDIEELIPVNDSGDSECLPNHKKYKCQNPKQKRNVIEAMVKNVAMFKNILPAFDGEKNLYTRKLLPFKDKKVFTVNVPDDFNREKEIMDGMKGFTENSINLELLHQLVTGRCSDITEDAITGIIAIETILRHSATLHLVPVGSSFFTKPRIDEVVPLSGGKEIWFGHHQSIQLGKGNLMLNVDRLATSFYKSCSVIEFMFEVLYPGTKNIQSSLKQFRGLTDAQRMTLTKEMRFLRVEVTHLPYPRKYRIRDITRENANNTFFIRRVDDKDVKCSVSEYFRTDYTALQYPNLPCLNVGSEKKAVYLPMEVCNVVEGQHYNKKLTEKQSSDLIRYTACHPADRFNYIRQSVHALIRDFEPFWREFGIRVSPYPVLFTGRVLNPPQITYQKNQVITPFNGCWNMTDKRFYTGVSIEKWILLSFSTARFCDENALQKFGKMLIKWKTRRSVYFAPPLVIKRSTGRDGRPADVLRQARNEYPDLQLAIIVLPAKSIYSEIKTVAETELGLMTQCIMDVNATGRKCNPQLICNLCQKINSKMGGLNSCLSKTDNPAMIMGPVIIVGVYCLHPTVGDRTAYSTAAVVGSIDTYFTKYKASVRVQHEIHEIDQKLFGREIVVDLKSMMKEILQQYIIEFKGKKPEKVIIFRKGLGEDEYQKAMNYELREIRQACAEIAGKHISYQPPITFIVGGKCGRTRFIPADRRDGVGRVCNIPPGTTVDSKSGIVHPVSTNFFLCSHMGIQGTSRPSRYTILWDDNNFTVDQLQLLIYYLCHNYVRCTRSVSIPCPLIYARLAAARAKQYLIAKTEYEGSSSRVVFKREGITQECIEEAVKVVDNMQNLMYFV
ncbi:LOW QUALITY PROTEIN: protein argonaute-4-like [Centruroides vittatus]|uniref:LOW QUALITY PROTEIN: protein argonaute-4-like n=1 Tax=Centruroides vittatus TaxID=120091 RepID=UPI00350FB1F4